jgi:hypothetical protein
MMTQSGHPPENNLAKFGYIPNMKVGNLKTFGSLGYLLELVIKKIRLDLLFLQNKGLIISQRGPSLEAIWALFFLKNPLY